MSICTEECPSFWGGTCACKPVFDCPECGWVTECHPGCPIGKEVVEVCGYFVNCPEYDKNATCEHDGAPAYKVKEKD
jgi:hypothetical protein